MGVNQEVTCTGRAWACLEHKLLDNMGKHRMFFWRLSEYLKRALPLRTRKMSPEQRIDLSPPKIPGMKELDRNRFRKSIPILAVRVDAPKTSQILRSAVMKRLYIFAFTFYTCVRVHLLMLFS